MRQMEGLLEKGTSYSVFLYLLGKLYSGLHIRGPIAEDNSEKKRVLIYQVIFFFFRLKDNYTCPKDACT